VPLPFPSPTPHRGLPLALAVARSQVMPLRDRFGRQKATSAKQLAPWQKPSSSKTLGCVVSKVRVASRESSKSLDGNPLPIFHTSSWLASFAIVVPTPNRSAPSCQGVRCTAPSSTEGQANQQTGLRVGLDRSNHASVEERQPHLYARKRSQAARPALGVGRSIFAYLTVFKLVVRNLCRELELQQQRHGIVVLLLRPWQGT
jgi:hypothetical protein